MKTPGASIKEQRLFGDRLPFAAPDKQALLTQIAFRNLGLETLEERKSDALDFHSHPVCSISDALDEANQIGLAAGKKAK